MAQEFWQVDGSHSNINFSVRHMVVSRVRGRFARWSATLALDEIDPARSIVEATIEAASIDTGAADRDTHLKSADFLDVVRFPKLVFKGKRVEKISTKRYQVIGELTIRDVTREISLDVFDGGRARDPWGGVRAGFTAHASIERKDFGLTWNQILEAGGVLVDDRVEIEIEIEAIRRLAAQAA